MLNLIPVVLCAKSVQERVDELVNFIAQAPCGSLILASELCVSGYDFDGFLRGSAMLSEAVGSFDAILMERLGEALAPDKFLGFTHLVSKDTSSGLANVSILEASKRQIFNEFVLLNSQNVFYTQDKAKLFAPNNEGQIFSAGDERRIAPFSFCGLKIGVLICFELRFSELWARLKDCDIVLVPAMWGRARDDAYISLCKALAIINNCYVVASSSLDLEFAGVFLPTGELVQSAKFEPNLIQETKQNLGICTKI